MTMIRAFDIFFSIVGLLLFSPVFIVIAIAIKLTSSGPVIFQQIRVGKGLKDFKLLKFRTMRMDADKKSLLTVGGRDSRITKVGYYLRKYKLDELPQLINVVKGEMSIVGPRPEVRKFVNLFTDNQKETLRVLPGITDYASIAFRNENDLLSSVENPEEFYIKELIPQKVKLNLIYIKNQCLKEYFTIIFKTIITSIKG